MIVTQLEKLVFVAFNTYVVALDAATGQIAWRWEAPEYDTGEIALVLFDRERLIVSVDGYTWCLHPMTGDVIWSNLLEGMDCGRPALVAGNSVR
ncbi:MAG TPA: PQQ-binding-like beta-propeller repeat protein [Planctomycetota bacterium]|nr:PQQ-binding-like beta-propeller repeat protein [Planctomycetota bacterium]